MIFDISEERIASNDTAAHIYLRQYGRHDSLYVSPKLSLMMMRVEMENPSLLNLDALPIFGHWDAYYYEMVYYTGSHHLQSWKEVVKSSTLFSMINASFPSLKDIHFIQEEKKNRKAMIYTMKRCLQRGAEFRPPISELFVRCAIFELNSKWHASLNYNW